MTTIAPGPVKTPDKTPESLTALYFRVARLMYPDLSPSSFGPPR